MADREGNSVSPRKLTDAERAHIGERYVRGDSVDGIMADLDVSRATVYYTLDKLGIPRDRAPRAEVPENVGDSVQQTLAWALRTILHQQEELGRCRALLDARSATVDILSQRIAALAARIDEGEGEAEGQN